MYSQCILSMTFDYFLYKEKHDYIYYKLIILLYIFKIVLKYYASIQI